MLQAWSGKLEQDMTRFQLSQKRQQTRARQDLVLIFQVLHQRNHLTVRCRRCYSLSPPSPPSAAAAAVVVVVVLPVSLKRLRRVVALPAQHLLTNTRAQLK